MSKRDWQRDMEICRKATAPLWIASVSSNSDCYPIYQLKDKKPIELIAEVQFIENAIFIAKAREGWPVALEERARLERRVLELEEENQILRRVVEAKGISYNDALIVGRHLKEMEAK